MSGEFLTENKLKIESQLPKNIPNQAAKNNEMIEEVIVEISEEAEIPIKENDKAEKIIVGSPIENNEIENKLETEIKDEIQNEIENKVETEIKDEIVNKVETEIMDEIENKVETEIKGEIENKIETEIKDEIQNEIENKTLNESNDEINKELSNKAEDVSPQSLIPENSNVDTSKSKQIKNSKTTRRVYYSGQYYSYMIYIPESEIVNEPSPSSTLTKENVLGILYFNVYLFFFCFLLCSIFSCDLNTSVYLPLELCLYFTLSALFITLYRQLFNTLSRLLFLILLFIIVDSNSFGVLGKILKWDVNSPVTST